jgi:PEGA domain
MTTNSGLRLCLLASTVAFVVLLLAGSARAEPRSMGGATTSTNEEALINEGLALREKGDDEGALGSFRRAYELSKGARPLAQIALAEQALGRWADAEGHLGQAVLRSEDPWIARNKSLLEQALVEIQGHLGSLDLSGGVAGAEVRVNGTTVGSFPLKGPLRVPAGSVALEVRAPGYMPVARTVVVPSRGLAREAVVLVATVPAAPTHSIAPTANDMAATTVDPGVSSERSASTSWGPRKKVGVGLGAAAVASLGVGTAFLFVRDSQAKDYNRAGCPKTEPSMSCTSLEDKEQSSFIVGVVGLVGAAILGGAATYLFLTDHTGEQQTGVAFAQHTLRFGCLPGAGLAIGCAGEF